jgi:RNA polymerase sigma-70 factor, ECF subfamily
MQTSPVSGDGALIVRARRGDPSAEDALFERYRGVLERQVGRLLPRAVRRRVSVSDVVQETRLVAHAGLAAFEDRGDGSYRAWLLGIGEKKTQEAVRTHVRTARRALAREVSAAQPSGRVADTRTTPSEAAMASEQREAIRRALAALRPDDAQVLRLLRIEGLSLREAAACMGRSLEATKKLYGRALVRFGKSFDGDRASRS